MYEVGNLTYEEVEENFCKTFNIKQRKISDKKFIEILNVCWHKRMDMHFMGYAYGDGEDVEFATQQEYKKFVLFNLYDCYFYQVDCLRYRIQDLFTKKRGKK